jgi:hypothetical protein
MVNGPRHYSAPSPPTPPPNQYALVHTTDISGVPLVLVFSIDKLQISIVDRLPGPVDEGAIILNKSYYTDKVNFETKESMEQSAILKIELQDDKQDDKIEPFPEALAMKSALDLEMKVLKTNQFLIKQ